MNIRYDTHTHSVASGHAYSTVDELASGARARGLSGFVLTDHGPSMPGATHSYHFGNLRILPDEIGGVRFLRGIEANILDEEGAIDLAPFLLARLDFVMAGFHEICFSPRDAAGNTRALRAALGNPYVDALSHPGNPAFPIDVEAVVEAAPHGKALEINNSSFHVRAGRDANCLRIAGLCARRGVRILVASDAHYRADVGNFEAALKLVAEAGVPESLVVNADEERFLAFLAERKEARRLAFGAL